MIYSNMNLIVLTVGIGILCYMYYEYSQLKSSQNEIKLFQLALNSRMTTSENNIEKIGDFLNDRFDDECDEDEEECKRVIEELSEDEDEVEVEDEIEVEVEEKEFKDVVASNSHDSFDSYTEVENLDEDDGEKVFTISKSAHCPVVIVSGKRKGMTCGKTTQPNGYCKIHKKHVPVPMK